MKASEKIGIAEAKRTVRAVLDATGLDSFWKTWIASSIANEIAREENKKLRAEEIVEDE